METQEINKEKDNVNFINENMKNLTLDNQLSPSKTDHFSFWKKEIDISNIKNTILKSGIVLSSFSKKESNNINNTNKPILSISHSKYSNSIMFNLSLNKNYKIGSIYLFDNASIDKAELFNIDEDLNETEDYDYDIINNNKEKPILRDSLNKLIPEEYITQLVGDRKITDIVFLISLILSKLKYKSSFFNAFEKQSNQIIISVDFKLKNLIEEFVEVNSNIFIDNEIDVTNDDIKLILNKCSESILDAILKGCNNQ